MLGNTQLVNATSPQIGKPLWLKPIMVALTFMSVGIINNLSHAAGFYQDNHSVYALGVSNAGQVAHAQNALSQLYNVASLTDLAHSASFAVNQSSHALQFVGDEPGTISPDLSEKAHVSLAYVHPLNDMTTWGFVLYSPVNYTLEYPNQFVGSGLGNLTELKTRNLNVSIAYQINPVFSFGMGLTAQQLDTQFVNTEASSDVLISDFSGESREYGAQVGFRFKHTHIAWGFAYSSGIKHTLEGNMTIPLDDVSEQDVLTDIDMPDQWEFGIATNPNRFNKVTLLASVKRTDWRSLKMLSYTSTDTNVQGVLDAQLQEKYPWRATTQYAMGLDYYHNASWSFRAGLATDQSSVSHANQRSVRFAEMGRADYSVGFTYTNKQFQIDGAYRYHDYRDYNIRSDITQAGLPAFTGRYSRSSEDIGLQINYLF